MKKIGKRIMSLAILAVMLFAMVATIYAKAEATENKLLEGLSDYYSARYDGLGMIKIDKRTEFSVSEIVDEENSVRYEGMERYQQAADIVFTGVDCFIDDFKVTVIPTGYRITLNENVTINYTDTGCEDSFSFITRHTVTVLKDDTIYSDLYDECLVSGFCNEECEDISGGESLVSNTFNPEPSIITTYNPATYNLANAITYANLYALSSNPTYCSYSADCANFVSQCLHEGWVPFDTSGYNSGWYFNFPSHSGSYNWVNVDGFDAYWYGQGVSRLAGNTSNIIPGNPFYWRSDGTGTGHGHLMICVGYNSSGNLVYNAHTTNVSHGLVSSVLSSNSYTKYTECFNIKCSSHTAPSTYNYNASSHWLYCTTCYTKYGMSGHSFINSGTYQTCRFCGYRRSI